VKLMEGLGRVQFPITGRAGAKRFFEQGMALFYGFNLPEAERTFREVVRIYPNAAMGYWGIALAVGPTYNHDNEHSRFPEARAAPNKAVALAGRTTPLEQGLTRAMAARQRKRK